MDYCGLGLEEAKSFTATVVKVRFITVESPVQIAVTSPHWGKHSPAVLAGSNAGAIA